MGLFREERMCATCETVGYPKTRVRGSLGVEGMLWLFFLVPGIIYSLWRRSTKHPVCRTCGSTTLMPLHAAGAQRRLAAQDALVAEIVDRRMPVVEAIAVREKSTSGWVVALGCFCAGWFIMAAIVCGTPSKSVNAPTVPAQSAAIVPDAPVAKPKPKPKKSAKAKKSEPVTASENQRFEDCRAKLKASQQLGMLADLQWDGTTEPTVVVGSTFFTVPYDTKQGLADTVNCFLMAGKTDGHLSFDLLDWRDHRAVGRYTLARVEMNQ